LVFPADDAFARDIATAAGERLLKIREQGASHTDELRKAGDLGAQEFLAAELTRMRPGDAVLSEEAADDLVRLTAERVWIIDPLDGTREFGEPPRVDWAVHVALWEKGELTAGAVALPAQGKTLSTAEPPPNPPALAEGARIRLVVSRSRPPEFVNPARRAHERRAGTARLGRRQGRLGHYR